MGGQALTAIMLVNNEIGTIQPIAELAGAAHAQGNLFLCDAVQAFGRMPIPDGPDMIAISAHKIHGPKGIGALWVRDGIALTPQMLGGGQEQGMRSGTLSPALCAGFGAAAKLAAERMDADATHVSALWDRAASAFADWTINGSTAKRYKGNLNIRRDGVDAARLISECRNIAFSAGSACASGSGRPSHVLRALGLTDAQAKSSIRLGLAAIRRRKRLIWPQMQSTGQQRQCYDQSHVHHCRWHCPERRSGAGPKAAGNCASRGTTVGRHL